MCREIQSDCLNLFVSDEGEELVLSNVGHKCPTLNKSLIDLFLEFSTCFDPSVYSRSGNADFLAGCLNGWGALQLLKECLLEFVLPSFVSVVPAHIFSALSPVSF